MTLSTSRSDLAHPDAKTIESFFDSISARYDLLNSLMSFGLDGYWRDRMVRGALTGVERSILDLGVGTGKSLHAYLKRHRFHLAVGCDFSQAMLARAKGKLGSRADFVACDFHDLPFPSASFDIVTGSFILRSVQNLELFFSEAKRVLNPGGKAVFLELTRPANKWFWNLVYRPYLIGYVPLAGRLVSRHSRAYQFLSQSVQTFLEPERLKKIMLSAGFKRVSCEPLSFGIVSIIQGS